MKYLLILITSVFLFTACTSKKYFEPVHVNSDLNKESQSLSSDIKSMNRLGATLDNGEIITNSGVSKSKLPENFHFLNKSEDGKVLASNYKDTIIIGDEKLSVKNVAVAASLKDGKLALVYSDNSIELIDILSKKTLFKDYLPISLANDSRIANPYFMGKLLLYPTLNGKVIIVSLQNYKSIKSIPIDAQGEFNNIIFLQLIKGSQTLIAASQNKIVSITENKIISKSYGLRDIITKDKNIYIATIDGRIIKLDLKLNQIKSQKFKYSKVHSLGISDSLFAIESQGFLIKISEDFTSSQVYDFPFDNEKKLIVIDNKIYTDSKITTLP